MRIKDRIKMFEGLSSGNNDLNKKVQPPTNITPTFNNTTPLTATKTLPPTTHSLKPIPNNQAPIQNINNTPQNPTAKYHVQDNVILKPSQLKNKPNQFVQTTITKSQTIKPASDVPSWVKKQPIESSLPQKPIQKVQVPKFQAEGERIAKPSDIRKRLEELASENKIFLAPQVVMTPQVEIKRTQIHTVFSQQAKKYEVQTTIPKISVKQNAQKLSEFYNSKNQPQPAQQQTMNKEIPQQPTINNHQQIPHQHVQQPKAIIPQNNATQNITNSIKLSPPPQPIEQKPIQKPIQQQEKKQTKVELEGQDTTSMLLRLKNKNKRKRLDFDSDED